MSAPASRRAAAAFRSDQQFLPAAVQILETPQSPVTAAMTLAICALAAAALAWSYFGRIDIIAVAPGKFSAAGRTKVVEPLETGRVRAIRATDGMQVRAGDVLVELDDTEATAVEAGYAADLASARAEVARRLAALDAAVHGRFEVGPIEWGRGVPPDLRLRKERVLASDLARLQSDLDALRAQADQKSVEAARLADTIAAESDLISMLQQRVDMRKALLAVDAGTRASLLDATETLRFQLTTLATQKGQLAQAISGRDVMGGEVMRVRTTFVSDNGQKLADAERHARDDEQRLIKAESARERMTIRSPVSGTMQASALTNVGQVVTTGAEVMRVVPLDDDLEVEAYISNDDVGFVHAGQRAVVKVAAFPFTRYGTISATVLRVAGDAISSSQAKSSQGDPTHAERKSGTAGAEGTQDLVFPVILRPDRAFMEADGADVPFTPGMSVNVEIQTGKRRILEYLFSPLVETAAGALRER